MIAYSLSTRILNKEVTVLNFRLIYCSRPTVEVQESVLKQILEVAQAFNDKNGIRGALFYNRSNFLQCLEGDRSAVNKLYHDRILKDPRHTDFELLAAEESSTQYFDRWTMARIVDSEENLKLFVRYMSTGTFSPQSAASDDVLKFFVEALKRI